MAAFRKMDETQRITFESAYRQKQVSKGLMIALAILFPIQLFLLGKTGLGLAFCPGVLPVSRAPCSTTPWRGAIGPRPPGTPALASSATAGRRADGCWVRPAWRSSAWSCGGSKTNGPSGSQRCG